MLYDKDLTKHLRLRLSERDMIFLQELSNERSCTISSCIRDIIGEYRRSTEAIKTLQDAFLILNDKELSHGDTSTTISN